MGTYLRNLKEGTKLKITTSNSVYNLTILDRVSYVTLEGVKFKTPIEAFFNGSTWGGSTLKAGWIDVNMNMEFLLGEKQVLTTSSVKKAVVYGDDWEYDLFS